MRTVVAVVAAVLAGLLAYPAYAWICHPDPPGTRSLLVTGSVGGYSMTASRVSVDVDTSGSCVRRFVWNVAAAKPLTVANGGACTDATGLLPAVAPDRSAFAGSVAAIEPDGTVSLRAADGTLERTFTLAAGLTAAHVVLQDQRLFVAALAAATPDRPDRLLVYDTMSGALLHSWPLLERPTSLDVQGELALFSAQHGRGLYALRLSDGLTALVGLNRAGDTPQIEARGVVYHDDLYKGKRANGRVFLKFIPTAVVRGRLRAVARPFLPAGRVNAFSFDGARVGIAVGEAATGCDQLVFWNVPWHFDVELTMLLMPMKLTCPHGGGPRITDVAFAGVRLQWLATYGHVQRLLTASIVNCDIETLRSGPPGATSLAGDENVLAYAAPGAARGVVERTQFGPTIAEGPALQVVADSGSVAALRAGGRVEVRAASGRLVHVFHVTGARAIALRRNDLAVLTRAGTVVVFNTASEERTHVWRVPAGAPAIDVHYGIAVLPTGRRVVVLDLDTGNRSVLAQALARVKAQIEAPGIVYAYNVGRRGVLRYIPTAKIEAALGR